MIQDRSLGRIELFTVPLEEDLQVISGTYTFSGRVLLTCKRASDPKDPNWYRVVTVNDDGTDLREVFAGEIPQKRTANGIRWMCFRDNRRVLLGDYVLEASPNLDRCESAALLPLHYPEEIEKAPGVFCHWSEIIISPDQAHMCWTLLTASGSTCYLGSLVRDEEGYHLEDIAIISSVSSFSPDPEHPGCMLPEPCRGGEVKQFVRGGRAVSEAGAGESMTDSIVQDLDSPAVTAITNTPGYEETTIFSPDETLGVVMSPRFSRKTNCFIFGLLPHPNSLAIHSLLNVAYMYCIAGVRSFRKGNIGPVMIEIERSKTEGRGYRGVNLSDPEGKWVYCSPISWSPDSTKAMWNETTRASEGPTALRLRVAKLLDRAPSAPVEAAPTPSSAEIPYAVPVGTPVQPLEYPVRVAGKVSGMVENSFCLVGEDSIAETIYHNYSDDGETFTDGGFKITTPYNMFKGGRTLYEGDMTVRGAHSGRMELRAVFDRKSPGAPSMLIFDPGEDGLPQSRGYAEYDFERIDIADMEP